MDAMTTDTNPYLTRVKELHDRKKELEAELARVRSDWREAMVDARANGVTVSDLSRETGVVAPNLFRVLRDGR